MRIADSVRELGRVRKNAREEFVISERVRHGQTKIEVRIFEQDGRQEMTATRHAMSFTRQALDELQRVLKASG